MSPEPRKSKPKEKKRSLLYGALFRVAAYEGAEVPVCRNTCLVMKYLYAEVLSCACALPPKCIACSSTFKRHVHISARPIEPMSVSDLTAKGGFVTTIPNQCQKQLPSRPTRPENIEAPVIEHQFTSAAYLGHARTRRFRRVEFGKSSFMGEIPCRIDAPDGSSKHRALQLDEVVVPSLHREETDSLQAKAARGQGQLAQVPPLGEHICSLDPNHQAPDSSYCLRASDTGPSCCVAVAVGQVVDWVAIGYPFCTFLCKPTRRGQLLGRCFGDFVRSQYDFEFILAVQDWNGLIANLTRDLSEGKMVPEMVCESRASHGWSDICAHVAEGEFFVFGKDELVDVEAQLQGEIHELRESRHCGLIVAEATCAMCCQRLGVEFGTCYSIL